MMKRRGFIATMLGAFAAPALPLPALATPGRAVRDKARFERWMIAFDWPRDQRRINFIVKGEITGFRYGMNWHGHVWHPLYRPMKIGDIVQVRKPRSVVWLAKQLDGHLYYEPQPTFEVITLTPEFLKTNGFPLPSIHEQYCAGKMSDAVDFKWFFTPESTVRIAS